MRVVSLSCVSQRVRNSRVVVLFIYFNCTALVNILNWACVVNNCWK